MEGNREAHLHSGMIPGTWSVRGAGGEPFEVSRGIALDLVDHLLMAGEVAMVVMHQLDGTITVYRKGDDNRAGEESAE